MSRETELAEFIKAFDDATPNYRVRFVNGSKFVGRSKASDLPHFKGGVISMDDEAQTMDVKLVSADPLYAIFDPILFTVPYSAQDAEIKEQRDEVFERVRKIINSIV